MLPKITQDAIFSNLDSFTLVNNRGSRYRLVVRLSHAQYDGVCLPVILKTLTSIYDQLPLSSATNFSTFLAYSRQQRAFASLYWRELLKGSRVTQIIPAIRPKDQTVAVPRKIESERFISTPQLPEGLTIASLVASAWAVVLSHVTGHYDVVYGYLVARRNSNVPEITEIVGPCVNIMPVRAYTSPTRTSAELL